MKRRIRRIWRLIKQWWFFAMVLAGYTMVGYIIGKIAGVF